MRLSTKLLTILPATAIVGATVPAIASCSCSKNQYLFNYGEHINCRDKDDADYHKPDEVKEAAKVKAAKAEKSTINGDALESINSSWKTSIGQQLFFYDLVASTVINDTINLKDWKVDENKATFTLNGITYSQTSLKYVINEDKTLSLSSGDGKLKCRSYTYYDCTYSE